jgi:hypothetical protein
MKMIKNVLKNAYLGVVYNSVNRGVETTGNYKVLTFAAKMKGSTSVLNKYTDFILSIVMREARKINSNAKEP